MMADRDSISSIKGRLEGGGGEIGKALIGLISQDTANSIVAWFANTIGAAESVLRVAATGHDKRLFFKVIVCLYILSSLGRLVSGVTIAYAGNVGHTLFANDIIIGFVIMDKTAIRNLYCISLLFFLFGLNFTGTALCLFCLCMLAENSQSGNACISRFLGRGNGGSADSDAL
ncbi:hypothetical protein SADUNF_Sadunf08G0001800 [Salix dunnii]|uniref:Reticulon domain-containing protein n=1 Tax=Salix dunnii TaxID=1413687 RepID=A0A835JYV8_9ROSI|nr:hypothetical protein SADUNF_Sadunf08G0001800 [Salix dunnii]